MKLTEKQQAAAHKAWGDFILSCVIMGTDRNRHDGIAFRQIARALMKATPGLKYRNAQQWAVDFLAENWLNEPKGGGK